VGTDKTAVHDSRSHCSPMLSKRRRRRIRSPIRWQIREDDCLDRDVRGDINSNGDEIGGLEVGIAGERRPARALA
jgi:hypothetical protein